MKKLKLKLGGKAMLSKDQMKKISGGYSSCVVTCSNGRPLYDYPDCGASTTFACEQFGTQIVECICE